MGTDRADNRATRRTLLAGLGSVVTATLGGCSGIAYTASKARYDLLVFEELTPITQYKRWEPQSTLWADHQRSLVDKLVRGNEVTTRGYTLTAIQLWGDERRAAPAFVEHDGQYYELEIDSWKSPVTVDRWIFWFDSIEGTPPDDATVVDGRPSSLSKRDAEVFEAASISAKMTLEDGTNLENAPNRVKGFVYHQYDPEDSSLVPDPPFTHVKINTPATDSPVYFEVVAEQVPVKASAYTYVATPIAATSTAEYKEYLEREVYEPDLSADALSSEAQRIFESAIGGVYKEREPLSDAYRSLLDRLGYENLDPQGRFTSYSGPHLTYDGGYYFAGHDIKQPSEPKSGSSTSRTAQNRLHAILDR